MRNHSAPIFSLFEVQTVCGLGIHLTLRLSLHLKTASQVLRTARTGAAQGEREEGRGEALSCLPLQNQTASPALCSQKGANAATQLSKYQAT